MTKYAEYRISKQKWETALTLYDIEDLEQENNQLGYANDHFYLGEFRFDDGVYILVCLDSGRHNYYLNIYAEDENGNPLDIYDSEDLDKEIEIELDENTYICEFIITEED